MEQMLVMEPRSDDTYYEGASKVYDRLDESVLNYQKERKIADGDG